VKRGSCSACHPEEHVRVGHGCCQTFSSVKRCIGKPLPHRGDATASLFGSGRKVVAKQPPSRGGRRWGDSEHAIVHSSPGVHSGFDRLVFRGTLLRAGDQRWRPPRGAPCRSGTRLRRMLRAGALLTTLGRCLPRPLPVASSFLVRSAEGNAYRSRDRVRPDQRNPDRSRRQQLHHSHSPQRDRSQDRPIEPDRHREAPSLRRRQWRRRRGPMRRRLRPREAGKRLRPSAVRGCPESRSPKSARSLAFRASQLTVDADALPAAVI